MEVIGKVARVPLFYSCLWHVRPGSACSFPDLIHFILLFLLIFYSVTTKHRSCNMLPYGVSLRLPVAFPICFVALKKVRDGDRAKEVIK